MPVCAHGKTGPKPGRHYMHLFDAMETATAVGLKLGPQDKNLIGSPRPRIMSFEELWHTWQPLALALNLINRGMGLPDLCPFVVPEPAFGKLRFVPDTIHRDCCH